MDIVVFDLIDELDKWWFSVKNDRSEITIEYKKCIKYTGNGIIVPTDMKISQYIHSNREFIDSHLEDGVIIVKDGGTVWEFFKQGRTDTCLYLTSPILVAAPGMYVLGKMFDNGPYTDLLNYTTWLKYQPDKDVISSIMLDSV